MRTVIIIVVIVAIIAALVAAWYFLIYQPAQIVLIEGAPCKLGKLSGVVQSGVCVPKSPQEETVPCGGKLNPC